VEALTFYDFASPTAITALDLGAVAPRSSDDMQIRLFNSSDSYQASDVLIEITGDDTDQLYVSLDGETFTSTCGIGDIPPNAISAPFWLRRVTASTATTGPATATLSATPGAWTYPLDTTADDDVPLPEPEE
jgi:hypothetical protein